MSPVSEAHLARALRLAAWIALGALPAAALAATPAAPLPGLRAELRDRPTEAWPQAWEVYLVDARGAARSIGFVQSPAMGCTVWAPVGFSRGARRREYVLHLATTCDPGPEEPNVQVREDLPFMLGDRLDDFGTGADVLAYLVDCDPADREARGGPCEAVGFLGFSEKGRIALTLPSAEGNFFTVRNLVNDAVVAALPGPDRALLRKERIRPSMLDDACRDGPFSAWIDGGDILFSRRGEAKRVAKLPPAPPGAKPPRVLGCPRSPYEPRVAVLYEYSGPDGRRAVGVAGAHLESGFSACVAGGCVPCAGAPAVFEELSLARNGCGIGPGGALSCWGDMLLGRRRSESLPPVSIPGRWAQVAVGSRFACAIAEDRSLWCFGPRPPARMGGWRWKRIAARAGPDGHGPERYCGIREDGALWCWSAEGSVEATPSRVGEAADWIDVAIGGESCGIRAPGALHCWSDPFPAPGRSGNATDWVRVSAGGEHVCALQASGALSCFGGYLPAGILAPDDNPTWSADEPVRLGTARYVAVAAGGQHTCAIREGGTLWCWGSNQLGQLGRARVRSGVTPEQVGGSAGWLGVATGATETCARRSDGTWCFGSEPTFESPTPPKLRQLCAAPSADGTGPP